jgi:DNA-binding response OmpR family regulator
MNAAPKKILVVDDDADIREIISFILTSEGYEVIGLDNGHQVLETAQHSLPDVILLDVMLGDMDGRDICQELKLHHVTKQIPIIIISATHGRPGSHDAKDCDADDYLGKPFDIADLVDHVKVFAA